jgi:hypothetical protein
MDPHPLRLSMTLQEVEGSALSSGRFNTQERGFMSHFNRPVGSPGHFTRVCETKPFRPACRQLRFGFRREWR